MDIVNVISLILFIIFAVSYLSKLMILAKRDRIHANVLGKSNKVKEIRVVEKFVRVTTSLWVLVWIMEIFFEKMIASFIGELFNSTFITYIGIGITILGISIFIFAMVFMKSSWRVGIDKETKSKLITAGIYKFSRNPAFTGFDLAFIGLFLTFPNILTLLIVVVNILALHLLILQEENHLIQSFGQEYEGYMKRTSRYF